MKTRGREGAKAGGYLGKFKELIRPKNKVDLLEGKDGKKRVMFRIKATPTGKGTDGAKPVDIPLSTQWDLDAPGFRALFGAIGVPADKIKKVLERTGSITKTLIWIEKEAIEAAHEVTCYVGEDGGFGSKLAPANGEFEVQYAGISSKAEDGTLHWYERDEKSGDRADGKGKWKIEAGKAFRVGWEVVSGVHRGARYSDEYYYTILKDDEDEWEFEYDSREGQKLKQLMTLHKIDMTSIDPDRDFKDAENGLPELDKKLMKKRRTLKLKVGGGWPKGLKKADGTDDDEKEPVETKAKEYRADEEKIGKLFAMIDRRVKLKTGKSAWDSDGELSKSGRKWLEEHELVTNFPKLIDEQVDKYIKRLKDKFPVN